MEVLTDKTPTWKKWLYTTDHKRVGLLYRGGSGLHIEAGSLELVEEILARDPLLLGDLMDSLLCHAV